MTFVKSKLDMKATASLNEQVLEELQVPDPTPEEAEAALKVEDESELDKD